MTDVYRCARCGHAVPGACQYDEATRAMLKALKAMCDEPVGVTAAQWHAAYNAIAQAEAAGITTGEDKHD